MSKKKVESKVSEAAPEAANVVTGIAFPDKRIRLAKTRPPQAGVGARGVRLVVPSADTFTASEAGDRHPGFPAGGSAFAVWVRRNHQIRPDVRRTMEEWDPLLVEFTNRPISGHRRSSK